jgi:hypothetical protein
MDPSDPLDAQRIVVEYMTLLERDVAANRHPAPVDSLPYAKSIIEDAIRTSVTTLSASDQLTDELRSYFEAAYILLAEYLDDEVVELMTVYRDSAEQLTAQAPHDRTKTAAWRTIAETSALAGEIARAATGSRRRTSPASSSARSSATTASATRRTSWSGT